MTTMTETMITPQEALLRLKEGNFRFVNNMPVNKDLLSAVEATRNRQTPYAAILSCMDSRTSAELVFDQGVGDIFSIRIAGNVITDDVLGSLEYATAVAGARLILVLGHTNCGAVKGACDHVEMGHLTSLLQRIQPALDECSHSFSEAERAADNDLYVAAVTGANIQHSMKEIRRRSTIMEDLIVKGELGIAPALYDVGTGKVTFGKIL